MKTEMQVLFSQCQSLIMIMVLSSTLGYLMKTSTVASIIIINIRFYIRKIDHFNEAVLSSKSQRTKFISSEGMIIKYPPKTIIFILQTYSIVNIAIQVYCNIITQSSNYVIS